MMGVNVRINGFNWPKLNENLLLDVAPSITFHSKEVGIIILCLFLGFKGLWVKPIHVADSISILFNIAPWQEIFQHEIILLPHEYIIIISIPFLMIFCRKFSSIDA